MITHILIAVNIVVLLVLSGICIRETRNVNGHILNLAVAMRLEQWFLQEEEGKQCFS